ncbi:RNA pyrophosphohydrolase [Permianibacter aggregans]|uniref:RNA pyrophosphohydrolase n=1 Tax=Permianibacter aggregans TaxID=1510150 RepID=A0A4V3D7Z1_9GAMM|nr:RNA pyrophosphohydrolase [Permianibacter aggregans]QGX39501.1 RNA pyrophosphohydrolase [Permianibacter aggregans]TDQ49757.1 putative (di)nucleoside polyphosphate hydrolase [Permianibacter aggregans]
MIDAEGYRANVGIVICNREGQLFWARRKGHDSWQFPQGGINVGESPEQALFRELREEVGLTRQDVRVLGSTRDWLRYRLPSRYMRHDSKPLCIGQKQRWFLLQLTAEESRVQFDATDHPEFDQFMWVSYWYPVRQVIAFKREVYRQALAELLPLAANLANAGEVQEVRPGRQRDRQDSRRHRRRKRHG